MVVVDFYQKKRHFLRNGYLIFFLLRDCDLEFFEIVGGSKYSPFFVKFLSELDLLRDDKKAIAIYLVFTNEVYFFGFFLYV